MTIKANNKVTTTKQVTNKAVKTATTPRKTKAIKTGYQFNYRPSSINTVDVLKTGHYALPVYGTIKPRNAEPLTLSHFIDRVKPMTIKVKAKRTSHEYIGKTNQPVQNGVRLPKPETQCGKSWALCDEYYKQTGVIPTPKTIGNIGLTQGINYNTASSEVSQWRYYHFGHDAKVA